MRRFLMVVLSLLALPLAAQLQDLGDVAFANSGAAAAQAEFLQGLAWLHDFEYPAAAGHFRKAQEIDPSFAMAYWGEAMTFTHPIWFQQDLPAARAVLERLGATPAARAAKAATVRERDYLAALEILYGEGSKDDRDDRYAEAMMALHARYGDDVDATAFAALALLGTSHHGRDFPTYMRSAAMLEEVFPSHQRHPGVLHYLIHSYDDPIHAPLGMRAARLYGKVAPEAGHALHMTSHIFVALGMWDDVIAANRQAIAVVNRQRALRKKQIVNCGHYPDWLHYAYLQQRRFEEAAKALEDCRAITLDVPFESAGEMDRREGRFLSLATMRAHQIASGGAAASSFAVPDGAPFAQARFQMAYGDVLAAASDRQKLQAAVQRLHVLGSESAALPHAGMGSSEGDGRRQVMMQEADALLLLASNQPDQAMAMLQKAAAAEQAMPFEFGPPPVPKPANELLGDVLLSAGRSGEAEKAYRDALARAPGRTVAVKGLEIARKKSPQAVR
ncbi:MAG: hypothetical protein ABIP63_06980 [Thermoanaerobaculia bacterium]